ncbi:MAG: thiamine pyrophosphate-dependent enzyme, partial [Chloroflexi bacterium]|nr:thiamine pyrophosphate-dependent enzyme [Chloroflexota bacterium]
AVYGMTGGQMAPTTLRGMKTSTTPYGRDHILEGHPIKMSEILAMLEGVAYIERVAVNSPVNIRKTKKAIAKAFEMQLNKRGFSMVEILSPCPTNWKMSSIQAWKWIDEEMTKVFPLGVFKDVTEKKDAD